MNKEKAIAQLLTAQSLIQSALAELQDEPIQEIQYKPVKFNPVKKSKDYNIGNIRALLTTGFGIPELLRICDNPEFSSVKNELADLSGKATVVSALINYSDNKLLFPDLLGWCKSANLARYESCGPYQ